ncbi:portal protein [Pseudanabaena phage Pan2]|nr:portal protein [Pseudanabaena phage Pan2]
MAKASNLTAITESQTAIEAEMLKSQLAEAHNLLENTALRMEESMSNLSLMADSVGWLELVGYTDDGPTLAQVQEVAKKLRNLTGLNSHIGRGARARHSYIWEGGLQHSNVPGSQRGRGTNVQAVINDPVNQANFFGAAARERQEKACYASGHYFVIGEEATTGRNAKPKRLYSIPIWQISAALVNPDIPDEVWAIRRSWAADGIVDGTNYLTGRGDLKHEWVYLNAHIDKRGRTVNYNGGVEPVSQSKRLFAEVVNRQEGWLWGLPDAVAAFAWADQYRRGLINGIKMQEALATLAFKLTGKSAAGAANGAVKVQSTTVKGGTAAMVDGMDVAALSTAGKGYDFDSLRPVLAAAATAIDISVVALSSDPGAAGSSYGSAQTLDLPTRLAMEARRAIHVAFEKEILTWLGAPNARVWFQPLVDGAELYRLIQAIVLKWNSGVYEPEEIKAQFEALMGVYEPSAVPEGVLIPNNEMSLPRKDIDTDSSGVGSQAPSADQGQSNGTGGVGDGSGQDIRNDQLT